MTDFRPSPMSSSHAACFTQCVSLHFLCHVIPNIRYLLLLYKTNDKQHWVVDQGMFLLLLSCFFSFLNATTFFWMGTRKQTPWFLPNQCQGLDFIFFCFELRTAQRLIQNGRFSELFMLTCFNYTSVSVTEKMHLLHPLHYSQRHWLGLLGRTVHPV